MTKADGASIPAHSGYLAVLTGPTDPTRRALIDLLMSRGRWIEADHFAAAWLLSSPRDIWAIRVRAFCAVRRFDHTSAQAFCLALQEEDAPVELLLTPVIAAQLAFGDIATGLANARIALTHPEIHADDPELIGAAVQAAVAGADLELLRIGLRRAASLAATFEVGRATMIDARDMLRRALLDTLRARSEVT